MKFTLIRLLPFLFALLPLKAFAAGEFSGILLDNNLTPSFSPQDTMISGHPANFTGAAAPAISAGLLLGTTSADMFGFEGGLIYLNRSYTIKSKVPFLSAETQTDTYSQTAQSDYGLLFSAAFKIHYEAQRAVLIEGRYAMGLNDVNKDFTSSTPHVVEKYSEFQLVLGIQRSF
jgi:hypothetical protein